MFLQVSCSSSVLYAPPAPGEVHKGLQLSVILPHTNLTLSGPLFPGEDLSAARKEEAGPKSHMGHKSPRDLESSRYYRNGWAGTELITGYCKRKRWAEWLETN